MRKTMTMPYYLISSSDDEMNAVMAMRWVAMILFPSLFTGIFGCQKSVPSCVGESIQQINRLVIDQFQLSLDRAILKRIGAGFQLSPTETKILTALLKDKADCQ